MLLSQFICKNFIQKDIRFHIRLCWLNALHHTIIQHCNPRLQHVHEKNELNGLDGSNYYREDNVIPISEILVQLDHDKQTQGLLRDEKEENNNTHADCLPR